MIADGHGAIPGGWRFCPDCNGEGVVSVMQAVPGCTEYHYDCERCQETEGLVPIEVDQ